MRPTFNDIYMKMAELIAMRSTCSRRQVGCIITTFDNTRVLSVGYNGNAKGLPNQCDNPTEHGKCGCIHAEENALIACSELAITPKKVFVTVFPCVMCLKKIVQLQNVKEIHFLDDYYGNNFTFETNILLLKHTYSDYYHNDKNKK